MSNSGYVDVFGSENVGLNSEDIYDLTEEEEANLITQSKNNDKKKLETNKKYVEINIVLCDRYGIDIEYTSESVKEKKGKTKKELLNENDKVEEYEHEVVEKNKCTGEQLNLAFNRKFISNNALHINKFFETYYRKYPENDIKILFYKEGELIPFGIYGVKSKYVKDKSHNRGMISRGIFLSNDDGGILYDMNENVILIGEVLPVEKKVKDKDGKEITVPDNDKAGIFIFDDFIKNSLLNEGVLNDESRTSIFEMTDEFFEKNITQRRLKVEENIKRRGEIIERNKNEEENIRKGLIEDEEDETTSRNEREKEYIEEDVDEKTEGGKRIRRKTHKRIRQKTKKRKTIKHKKRKTIKRIKRKTHKRRH
jgi:hypothetical protein